MKNKQYAGSSAIIFSLLLGVSLQGCFAPAVKQNHEPPLPKTSKSTPPKLSPSSQLSDAAALKLFQKGSGADLSALGKGYKDVYLNGNITKKSLDVKNISLLRKAILSTGRGKVLASCQFPALRIELDGKKATSDWLVTTKGIGRCAGNERYFWIIQQGKAESSNILLAGRGSYAYVNKPNNSALSELSIRNAATIKINHGDKLADGDWLQVKSSDKGRVEIYCDSKFRLQNNRFEVYEESVEASVNTPMLSNKTWQPVNNPRYRCPF